MFSRFLTEVVSIEKKDGKIIEGVKAGVQSKMIFVTDVSLPIEEGDKIIRLLPSGVKETLVVTDPGYSAGMGGIKAHYQIKYRKEGSATPKTATQKK